MHEVILDKPEIDVLKFEHTSLTVVDEPTVPVRRKKKHRADYRDKIIVIQWFLICAFAVWGYIAQAGPIW